MGYEEDTTLVPYKTTFYSLYDRAGSFNEKPPYDLPRRFREGRSLLDLSTPFNFAYTADTIGGNSGSPVINRAGEIVGVNFDSNIQKLPNRYAYIDDKEGSRAVAVHSAAIIEALRKLYGAEKLAAEILGRNSEFECWSALGGESLSTQHSALRHREILKLAETTSSLAPDAGITEPARERNTRIIERLADQVIELEPKFLVQMAHLTTPATVWKYVEGAATRSAASLVMLDLEDSIPRDSEQLLDQGRGNVIPRSTNWTGEAAALLPSWLELDQGTGRARSLSSGRARRSMALSTLRSSAPMKSARSIRLLERSRKSWV
jgi:hypothetical protein